MKTCVLAVLISTFGLSPFTAPDQVNPEQIAFDYFISEILKDDFKNLQTLEFKGRTEENYAALGDYKFCLTPERLGPAIKNVANGERQTKQINYKNFGNLEITGFTENKKSAKLYLFKSVTVADSYYILLSIKIPNDSPSTYLFEVTQDGKLLRSCKAAWRE